MKKINKELNPHNYDIIYVDSGIRTQATSVEGATALTSVLP